MGQRKDRPPIKVNTIADLRRHALQTLDKLVDGDMEVEDAHAASKLYGNVIDMLKAEVDYNKMLGKHKEIEFLEQRDTKEVIDQEVKLALESKSTSKW